MSVADVVASMSISMTAEFVGAPFPGGVVGVCAGAGILEE